MKECGIILLILGILLAVYSFTMDTSVAMDIPVDRLGETERVVNLGLMNLLQNLVIGSMGLCLMCTVLLVGNVIATRHRMIHLGLPEPVREPKNIETIPAR